MAIRNEPTAQGCELGEHVARIANAAFKANPSLRRRCDDCAFRPLTRANGCAASLMDGLKCVIEKTPFYCHLDHGDGKDHLCAGWEALIDKDAPAMTAPWSAIGGFDLIPPHPVERKP